MGHSFGCGCVVNERGTNIGDTVFDVVKYVEEEAKKTETFETNDGLFVAYTIHLSEPHIILRFVNHFHAITDVYLNKYSRSSILLRLALPSLLCFSFLATTLLRHHPENHPDENTKTNLALQVNEPKDPLETTSYKEHENARTDERKCKLHHHGQCTVKFGNCKKVDHMTRDCRNPTAVGLITRTQRCYDVVGSLTTLSRVTCLPICESSTNANVVNNQRVTGASQKAICYECGNPGHYRSDCPERNNQNHENQTGVTRARGVVHALRGGETDQDPNNIKDKIEA
ncbi:reverse transcriptase domain-containing protein [Tanacetum coccineum]